MKTSTPISVLKDLPYFDGHCDTLTAFDGRYGRLCLELDRESFSARGQVFAICGDISPRPMDELFGTCISRYFSFPGVAPCRSAKEFIAAEKAGLCAGVLGIEGAEVIDCSLEKLEKAAEIGVKIIAPTWNIYNGLCGTASEMTGRGLTSAGIGFCRKAVALGMKLDVSHASDCAIADMAELFPGSVFASHSNSRAVCGHRRNIPDELFSKIASVGGCVGINLYSPFVDENCADISRVADHICHFVSLVPGGEKHVSLGCDLDGCDSLPAGISGSVDVALIAEELFSRGFDRESIIDIFHNNLFRFIF